LVIQVLIVLIAYVLTLHPQCRARGHIVSGPKYEHSNSNKGHSKSQNRRTSNGCNSYPPGNKQCAAKFLWKVEAKWIDNTNWVATDKGRFGRRRDVGKK